MRLYIVQSTETGCFLVPDDGFVSWTLSLRRALETALVDYETACELCRDHADHAEVVFVREVPYEASI